MIVILKMRLDKYLKNSRLIKRRTIAKEICDNGRIFVNGTVAKASTTVKVGEVLLLQIGAKQIKAKITNILEIVTKDTASTMYEIID